MRILLGCDVLLDVALQRDPHFEDSGRLVDWAERNPGKAAIAWHTFSNVFYLCGKGSRGFIEEILEFAEIPPTDTNSMRLALETGMKDLEDAMQVAAAESFGAQIIATRNVRDYSKSPIKALKPEDIVRLLEA